MRWWWITGALIVGFFGGRLLAPSEAPKAFDKRSGDPELSGDFDGERDASTAVGELRASYPGNVDVEVAGAPLSEEWFESIEEMEPLDRMGYLIHHLGDVGANEFRVVMERLESEDYGRIGWQIRSLLGAHWAEVDPRGMLAYVEAQPGRRARGLINTLFASWAKRDVTTAFEAARQLETRHEQQIAVQAVINGIAAQQPTRAIELAREFYGGNLGHQGQWVFRSIYQTWAKEDGDAARASALALEGGAMKSGALAGAMADWMEADPVAALGWLDALPVDSAVHGSRKQVFQQFLNNDFDVAKDYIESVEDPTARRAVLENLQFHNLTWQKSTEEIEAIVDWIGTVARGQVYDSQVSNLISAMTQSDPDRATEFVLNMRPGNARMNSLGSLGNQLAMSDPVAALAFVDSLPYEDEKQRVLNSMSWALTHKSVELSSRLIGEHNDPLVQQQLASRIASEWADYDVPGALAWSESLSDEQASESAVSDVLGRWIESDPAATLAYIDRRIEGEKQGHVLQRAYNQWARSDPEEAVAWLDRLPEGTTSHRASIYRTVANAYIRHDPMAASEWISEIEPGPERDQSVESLVSSIAKTDPEAGFIWAGTMGDANQRKNSLRRAVVAWKEADPEAAHKAVMDADLEAADKEPLLKMFE